MPIFVVSPYAKSGGYVRQAQAHHYSLLATIDDGLGLEVEGMCRSSSSRLGGQYRLVQ